MQQALALSDVDQFFVCCLLSQLRVCGCYARSPFVKGCLTSHQYVLYYNQMDGRLMGLVATTHTLRRTHTHTFSHSHRKSGRTRYSNCVCWAPPGCMLAGVGADFKAQLTDLELASCELAAGTQKLRTAYL